MDREYNWNDRLYPYFYPAEDDYAGVGRYRVEFHLTCCPYKRASSFDENAFPLALRGLGYNGNTNFYLIAHDVYGGKLVNLKWDDAVTAADYLNDLYEEELDGIEESWEWESLGYEIRADDVIYNK